MAVLFAGTSTADFDYVSGSIGTSTVAGDLSPNVAEGINVVGDFAQVAVATQTEIWVTYYIRNDQGSSLSSTYTGIFMLQTLGDATGDGGMYIKHGQGSMTLYVHNGSSYVSQGSFSVTNNTLYRIDVRFKIDASAGAAYVYLNGELILSGTGLDTTAKITEVNAIGFYQTGPLTTSTYSAIIAADETTRGMDLIPLAITGNGTLTDWTGDYTDIDETGYDDGDFIASTTGGDQETYTFDLTVPNGYVINSIVVSARMANYGDLVSGIKAITYQSATAYDMATYSGIEFLPDHNQIISDTNPATGLAWLEADITGGELGFETIA